MANGWGGKRAGAGRPIGAKSKYPPNVLRAAKTMQQGKSGPRRWRVPDDAPEELKLLADRALERIEDVMEERVFDKQAQTVLKAAAIIREEVCGPHVRQLNVNVGLDVLLAEIHTGSGELAAAAQVLELENSDIRELPPPTKKRGRSQGAQRNAEVRSAESEDLGTLLSEQGPEV